MAGYGGNLDRMRSKAQLVLSELAMRKPSGVRDFLAELRKSDSVSGYHFIAARDPSLVDLPADLDPSVRSALAGRGIQKLYSHQALSFEYAQNGKNVVVVTPTASGKTLCYNLPVLQRIARNPDARALYLYPTKALTYDQLDDLMDWGNALGKLGVFSYDGDTPQDARRWARQVRQHRSRLVRPPRQQSHQTHPGPVAPSRVGIPFSRSSHETQ